MEQVMTKQKKQSRQQKRGFRWLHENELSQSQRTRIVKMHENGYTSAEIGEAMKIASDDVRDPYRPVRHILNALRFQGIIEGHAPRGKRATEPKQTRRKSDGNNRRKDDKKQPYFNHGRK